MADPQNPPAFPQALSVDEEFNGSEGMSLRDYFAGRTLAGLITYHDRFIDHTELLPVEAIARDAYLLADAVLAERAKASR